jgi:hypothetical protein
LKVLGVAHDSKAPLERFRNCFAQAIVELDVDKPDGLEKWGLSKRPFNSGSRYARSIIAYYAALWRTIAQDGYLPAPVVIDSPNQGAQDKEHLQELLAVLAATAPAHTQVILAHEELPDSFDADKVVNLRKEERLLTHEGFKEVSPELFRFVEDARAAVAGIFYESDNEDSNSSEFPDY